MARVTVQPSTSTALGSGGARVRSSAAAVRRDGWLRRLPLLPALVYVILITQLPFVLTIFYSLQKWNLLYPVPARFIGLQNYLDILNDPSIRTAIWNTIVLTISAVTISVALGVGIAVLLNREIFGKGILRTLMIGPFLVMPTAAALMWKDTLLNPLTGFINYILTPIGLGSFDFINRFPMASIVGIEVWRWTPFMMLIVLAGLQSQNQEVPRGRGGRRRSPPANVPLYHAALHPSIYRTRCAPGVAVHRAELRHHLHDHPGRSRGGDDQPSVQALSRGLPGL